MINKRLVQAVPEASASIYKNVLFQWMGLLCSIVSTLILAFSASELISTGSIASPLWKLAALTGCILLKTWFARLAVDQAASSSKAVKKKMRTMLFEKVCRLSSGRLEASSASLVQLMTEGVEQLETYFASYLPQFFYALIAPVTLFVLMVFWDWKTALVFLVCVPLIPASIVAVQKFAKKLLNKYWGQYTGLSDSFEENLQGLTTLKVYGADERKHKQMNEEAESFRKITMRVLIMQLNSISVMDFVAYGGSALGIALALVSFRSGNISLYQMIAIILLSAEFFLPMRLLGSYFHISMNGSAAADRMFAILDQKENEASGIPAGFDGFHARNLRFAYDESHVAINGISFDLPKTGWAGIAGESGSGKSTLAKLLCGHADGQGSLSISGMEVSDIDRRWLSDQIVLLDFESSLFEGTLRDNLKMANEFASDEEMMEAVKKAGLPEFTLESRIEEGGKNVSGGQRQRIAFARAILKPSSVLILDEATSAVDADTENWIMSQVKDLSKEKLVVCISHRLANLDKADVIYMMKDGQIVESGRKEDLLKAEGQYTNMWNAQKDLERYSALSKGEAA